MMCILKTKVVFCFVPKNNLGFIILLRKVHLKVCFHHFWGDTDSGTEHISSKQKTGRDDKLLKNHSWVIRDRYFPKHVGEGPKEMF